MDRRLFTRIGGGMLAGLFASSARAQTATKPHRIAIQVSGGDPKVMDVALHNAQNAASYYKARNEAVAIEIVAFGPGYAMLRDTSPVKAEIAEMHKALPFIVFSACQNSRAAVAKAEGKTPAEIVELPDTTDVPAGIVRVSELQEQGWSYVRP